MDSCTIELVAVNPVQQATTCAGPGLVFPCPEISPAIMVIHMTKYNRNDTTSNKDTNNNSCGNKHLHRVGEISLGSRQCRAGKHLQNA